MANLERKLSKGYEKVGKKIGRLYDIYNARTYEIDPIDSANWTYIAKIALSESNFSTSQMPGFKLFQAFVSFEQIIVGSLLVNPDDVTDIYNVINHDFNHGVNAMKCFNKISVSTNTNTYDGTGITTVDYIKDLPCSIVTNGIDSIGGLIGQASGGSSFTHSATIRFQLVEYVKISIGDTIQDNEDNTYEIMSVEYSETGYKVITNGIRTKS